MVSRGKGMVRESGKDMYTLLYLKGITNKDLLCSTGNSAECGSLDGRGVWGRLDRCICVAEKIFKRVDKKDCFIPA